MTLVAIWAAQDDLAAIAAETKSWKSVGEAMRRLPGFGGSGFMTQEVLQVAPPTARPCSTYA